MVHLTAAFSDTLLVILSLSKSLPMTCALSALSALHAVAAESRPNIVFFLSDDQPLRAMSHVDPWFHTPNMDRLASEGIVFENGFVDSSVCAVSRASIMLGQHNATHLIQSFDVPISAEQIEKSFPVLLRKSGYRTAMLGKFAVGHTRHAPKELCLPADKFDLWYGFLQSPSYAQMVDGEKRYLTSVMEEKAIRFIQEAPKDQPFLVYMCLPEPHGQGGPGGSWNYRDPHFEIPAPDGPPPVVETMTEAAYDQLPEAIKSSKNNKIVGRPAETYTKYMETVRDYTARSDLAIGRIRAALEAQGLADNTVIIFAADNGSMWGAHGIAGKWNMYEESIRVPMMIYDPRLPKSLKGTRSQAALNIDLTATVMDVAGVPAPHMDGISLMPILKDPAAQGREDWYYLHDVYSRGKGKLPNCEGVRAERWKYIHYRDTDPVQEELFDIQADPKEMNDLSKNPEYAELLNKLRARNEEFKAQHDKAASGRKPYRGPEEPNKVSSTSASVKASAGLHMLETPINLGRGSLFVSFLAQRDAGGAFQVNFSNAKQQVRLGVSVDADGTVTPKGAGVVTSSAPSLLQADTAYRVVLKFSNNGKDHGAVTRVKLFPANGNLPVSPDGIDWDVATTGGKTGVTQDRVLLKALTGTVALDDLRVSRSWTEVR